jgi:hypothetical protein
MYFVFLMNQALNMQHQFIFSGVGADFLTDKIKFKKKKKKDPAMRPPSTEERGSHAATSELFGLCGHPPLSFFLIVFIFF